MRHTSKIKTALAAGLLLSLSVPFANAAGLGVMTEYPVPSAGSQPLHVGVTAASGVWFGEFRAGKVVYQMHEYDISPASGPMNIWVDDRDGSIWYSATGDYIAHTTTAGKTTVYSIPSRGSMPMGVTGDSKGNIWFAEQFTNKIGVVRPNGTVEEFRIPTPQTEPTGLTVDQYDNVWFAESRTGKIGVRRANGHFDEYEIPGVAHPMGINYCKDQKTQGVIWFTETQGSRIGSITQKGQFTLYTPPTSASVPQMVMEDMNGNVWFTEQHGNQIGRLRADRKTFTEYAIPTADSRPMGMSLDMNDGSVWFAEMNGNNLGHLIPLD